MPSTVLAAYFHFIAGQKHKPVSHAPLAVRRATELLVAMPAGIGSPQAQCRRKILQAAVSGGLQNLWYRPKISYYSQRLYIGFSARLYRATRMRSADNAVARCPSVCPSVTRRYSKYGYIISSKVFSPCLTILVFHTKRDGNFRRGPA